MNIGRLEELGKRIRDYKYSHYDSILWDEAIEKFILQETQKGTQEYFELHAYMTYFVSEPEKRLSSFEFFMKSFDQCVQNIKDKYNNYQLTPEEISKNRREKKPEKFQHFADEIDYIKKRIFLTNKVSELVPLFTRIEQIVNEHGLDTHTNTWFDIISFSKLLKQFSTIKEATKDGATKKELLKITGIDVGYFMAKMCDIGVFEKRKRGRENLYVYKKDNYDTNLLRKEWEWLRR